MSFKLAVDASVLLQPSAGIGTYTREILRAFGKLDPDIDLTPKK